MAASLQAWLNRLESLHPKSIDLGLERCGAVYRRMGSPRPAERVCTVAGTNGKGSVVAFLESLLRSGGWTCGCYTSPHILEFNERIRIEGEAVGDRAIVEALERVEDARDGVSLTYFEFTTLAALHILSAARLDAAVLEVGLGGRLDAVNLVDADCAVITAIGLDHQEYLGPDRESIGREKAGVMRRGQPVVLGDREPPQSLIEHARQTGARLLLPGHDFSQEATASGCRVRVESAHLDLPAPPLAGSHQRENLAVAITAAGQMYPRLLSDRSALASGVRQARLQGRLQRWSADPRIVLDVGHNPLAAEAVGSYLASLAPNRCMCVLGMLADKSAEGVASHLGPHVSEWLCAGLEGPRGQSGQALAERLSGMQLVGAISSHSDVAAALEAAMRSAGPDDLILVFGSFVTVGEAVRALSRAPYSGGQC